MPLLRPIELISENLPIQYVTFRWLPPRMPEKHYDVIFSHIY